MPDPRDSLTEVWTAFRSRGVADDLTIILHVAAVLLRLRGISPPAQGPWPAEYSGSDLDEDSREAIEQSIRSAVDAAGPGNPHARVLDPLALFRPTRFVGRGQYPTPRHVVRLMHRLAGVEAEHDVLDLACGSGGFLAHRPAAAGKTGGTVGVEVALRWAQIAAANAALHLGPGRAVVLQDNALAAAAVPLQGRRFARVLMNPPFGEKAARKDAEALARAGVSVEPGRSESALPSVALQMLADGGRAALLLPAGPLFSNGTAETALRTRLLSDEYRLDAVVALPRDSFQPYSHTQTHLLLVDRQRTETGGRTWFFRLEHDGYPPGQGRDLTQPPGAKATSTDFPLVEVALGTLAPSARIDPGTHAGLLARVHVVEGQFDGIEATKGVVLEATPGAVIESVEWHPPPTSRKAPERGFVLLVSITLGDVTRKLVIYPGGRRVTEWPDVEKWRRVRYPRPDPADGGKAEEGPDPHVVIYPGRARQGGGGAALAVTAGGVLLGLTAEVGAAGDAPDLRPEVFLGDIPAREAPASSGELLRQIRGRQHEAARHLDVLADLAANAARREPRPVPFPDGSALEVFGALSPEQSRVYAAVRGFPLQLVAEEGGEAYHVVPPFTTADVLEALAPGPEPAEAGAKPVHPAAVEATLRILEALGIVMRAHAFEAPDADAVPYYRLATPFDEPAPEAAPDAGDDA